MKSFLKNNSLVLLSYLCLLVASFVVIGSFKKTDIHLYLNSLVGNPFFDKFYFYITYLGDGNMAIVMLLLLMFYNVRIGLYCSMTFIFASLSSVGLKHFFFDDVNRPFYVFNYFEHIQLCLVDGVDVFIHNSFPSGHATQAFAIFMSLAFSLSSKKIKFLLLILAVLTAYSRVYISQHWLEDVVAGSFVGTSFSVLFYFLIFNHKKIVLLNQSLFKIKKT